MKLKIEKGVLTAQAETADDMRMLLELGGKVQNVKSKYLRSCPVAGCQFKGHGTHSINVHIARAHKQ
jgi:hypothetical protein